MRNPSKSNQNQAKAFSQGVQAFTVALVLAAGMSSMAQTSTTPGQNSISVGEVKTINRLNKVGLVLASAVSSSVDDLRTKGGAGTENSVSITYKPLENYTFAATLVNNFKFVGVGEDQSKQRADYRDLSLSLTTKYGGYLGTKETPVKYKFNLPTSPDSQTSHQAFSLGAEITFEYELADKLSSTVVLNPGWNVKNGASDEIKNQITGEVRYSHTEKLSTYGYIDHKIKAKTEASLPLLREIAEVGVGVNYSPNKIVDLGLSVSRERHVFASAANNESVNFQFFDPKEIGCGAEIAVKF